MVKFRVFDGDITMLNRLRKFGLQNIVIRENVVTFSTALINKSNVIRLLGKREFTVHDKSKMLTTANFLYSRGVFVCMAVVCIIAFVIAEQFAFRVHLSGNLTHEERTAINAYLDEIGISGITPKRKVRNNNVARDIVGHFDFVAMCNVSVRSSNIIVTAYRAENVMSKIPAGDIVAPCDGVIGDIVVFSGTAQVTRGDVVKKGDILVTGDRPTAVITLTDGQEVIALIDNTVLK